MPLFGDADLYVNVNGMMPTRSSFQYVSLSSTGVDSVIVRSSDRQVG